MRSMIWISVGYLRKKKNAPNECRPGGDRDKNHPIIKPSEKREPALKKKKEGTGGINWGGTPESGHKGDVSISNRAQGTSERMRWNQITNKFRHVSA